MRAEKERLRRKPLRCPVCRALPIGGSYGTEHAEFLCGATWNRTGLNTYGLGKWVSGVRCPHWTPARSEEDA